MQHSRRTWWLLRHSNIQVIDMNTACFGHICFSFSYFLFLSWEVHSSEHATIHYPWVHFGVCIMFQVKPVVNICLRQGQTQSDDTLLFDVRVSWTKCHIYQQALSVQTTRYLPLTWCSAHTNGWMSRPVVSSTGDLNPTFLDHSFMTPSIRSEEKYTWMTGKWEICIWVHFISINSDVQLNKLWL